jgi:hypothetical protein
MADQTVIAETLARFREPVPHQVVSDVMVRHWTKQLEEVPDAIVVSAADAFLADSAAVPTFPELAEFRIWLSQASIAARLAAEARKEGCVHCEGVGWIATGKTKKKDRWKPCGHCNPAVLEAVRSGDLRSPGPRRKAHYVEEPEDRGKFDLSAYTGPARAALARKPTDTKDPQR